MATSRPSLRPTPERPPTQRERLATHSRRKRHLNSTKKRAKNNKNTIHHQFLTPTERSFDDLFSLFVHGEARAKRKPSPNHVEARKHANHVRTISSSGFRPVSRCCVCTCLCPAVRVFQRVSVAAAAAARVRFCRGLCLICRSSVRSAVCAVLCLCLCPCCCCAVALFMLLFEIVVRWATSLLEGTRVAPTQERQSRRCVHTCSHTGTYIVHLARAAARWHRLCVACTAI